MASLEKQQEAGFSSAGIGERTRPNVPGHYSPCFCEVCGLGRKSPERGQGLGKYVAGSVRGMGMCSQFWRR